MERLLRCVPTGILTNRDMEFQCAGEDEPPARSSSGSSSGILEGDCVFRWHVARRHNRWQLPEMLLITSEARCSSVSFKTPAFLISYFWHDQTRFCVRMQACVLLINYSAWTAHKSIKLTIIVCYFFFFFLPSSAARWVLERTVLTFTFFLLLLLFADATSLFFIYRL